MKLYGGVHPYGIDHPAIVDPTPGDNNIAIGGGAPKNKTAGRCNLTLGSDAGINLIPGNNNMYILTGGGKPIESDTIRIGNTKYSSTLISGIRGVRTVLANAIPVYIDSNGQLGTLSSSEGFKKDIKDMNETTHGLLALRPVTYHYKQTSVDGKNPLKYSLIAEEVAKIYTDLVAYSANGNIETVQYQKLTPMLLNEMQRINRTVQAQAQENQAQVHKIAAQALKIAR